MPRWRQRSGWQGLDDSALADLYETEAHNVLIFLARRTFDSEVALDLMAETFAQAVLNRHKFRGADAAAAKAWLFGIARNQLAGYFKRGAVERRGLERLKLEAPTLPNLELGRIDELAGLDTLRGILRAELARLASDQRDAIALRVVEEMSYPEVAAHLGVSEQVARARVSRGLRALAAAIDKRLPEEVGFA